MEWKSSVPIKSSSIDSNSSSANLHQGSSRTLESNLASAALTLELIGEPGVIEGRLIGLDALDAWLRDCARTLLTLGATDL